MEKELDLGWIGIAFAAIGRFAIKLRNYFPSAVPQGMQEFEDWSSSIIKIYGFPDNDSVRFALATMIMHSGPSAAYVSKRHYAIMIKAGAAKQVASQAFTEIKQRQLDAINAANKAALEAEAANQQAAATATPEVAPLNVQPIQN
jgi:hypothetical protein